MAKNTVAWKYTEKRQFLVAPANWDRGVHPNFKARFEAGQYETNQKLIAACGETLEDLHSQLEAVTGSPSLLRERSEHPRQRKGWKQLRAISLSLPNILFIVSIVERGT